MHKPLHSPNELAVRIGPEKDSAQVAIAKAAVTLDAAGMEEAAWKIIDARGRMQPHRSGVGFVGSRVNVPNGGRIGAEPRPETAEVLIRVMHPGLGWIGVQLNQTAAMGLIDRIREAFDPADPQPKPE